MRSWMREGGIRFVPLAEETLSVVYASSLREEGQREPSLSDLAPLPFIAYSKSCAPVLQEVADRICARAGFNPRKVFVADQYDSVLRLVGAGLGWAIVPTLAYRNSRLEMRSMEFADLPERIVIGFASREDESDPYVLGLIEGIEKFFADSRPIPRSE